MKKKPVQIEEKIALAPAKPKAKPAYDFWPLSKRTLETSQRVTLKCCLSSQDKELSLKADLVFLNIQGDNCPNFFSLEFDKPIAKLAKESNAFESFVSNFSKLGNTDNLMIETDEFTVTCYRPICVSWEQRYANFCFKRGPDL